MTESPTTEAAGHTTRPARRPRVDRRFVLSLFPALVLLGIAAATAGGLFAGGDEKQPVVRELGGISWTSIDVERSASDTGFTIRAAVADDRLDGDDATPKSHYVLWMLGSGDYDDRPHVDSRSDERALGMSHDEQVQIAPIDVADGTLALIDSGTYTPSIDGEITYRDIPAGEYQLRALVMGPGGTWDGTLAARTVAVE